MTAAEFNFDECKVALGKAIRLTREHKGLTRAELGERIGREEKAIARIETGNEGLCLERSRDWR